MLCCAKLYIDNDVRVTRNLLDNHNFHCPALRYHEWGPEGIDIEAIVAFFQNRLFNYWGYKSERHLKWHGRFSGRHEYRVLNAAYLAIIGAANGEVTPKVYIAPKLIMDSAAKGKRLLPDVLPMMQQALSVELFEDRSRKQYPYLFSALEESSMPIIFQTSDWIWCSNHTYEYADENGSRHMGSIPRITWAKVKNCGYNFAIPDYRTVILAKQRERQQDLLERENDKYPSWEGKIPKAVWRGSFSNPTREVLVNKFSNHTNFDVAEVPYESRKGPFLKHQDFMNYRAVLDIDGHSWTDRFQYLLCQTSVVIKIHLSATSYFDAALTPGLHYLPATLENLTNVVEHAVSGENAGRMKSIISNANKWCQKHVVYKEIKKDILSILNGYSEELYRANSNWTSIWNHHSSAFLSGEKAWNETYGWVSRPELSEFRENKYVAFKAKAGMSGGMDLVFTGLPKVQKLPLLS